MSKILVINGGSSSIKFQLLNQLDLSLIAVGLCERIGIDGKFTCTYNNQTFSTEISFINYESAFEFLTTFMIEHNLIANTKDICGVGHRIVHGGPYVKESLVVDDNVKQIIKSCIKFAPLHNDPELKILNIAQTFFQTKHVVVFDTAFHHTIESINSRYAIPKQWEDEYGIKRYGAHGISYRYVVERMQTILNKPKNNLIVCHLGNGASVCAIKDNCSINTSMGLTPLEGLIMGTRSGNIDPTIIEYVCQIANMDVSDVIQTLNKKSGMLALTGYSDFREIFQHIELSHVFEGVKMYAKRVANYIIQYLNDLQNQCDGIVFTAGIGQKIPQIRQMIIDNIHLVKLLIDHEINQKTVNLDEKISSKNSKIPIFVVETNEELMIAKDVKNLI